MFQPIEPIPAVAPRPSLLTTARRLPDGVNWRTGVTFRDNGAHNGGGWPFRPGAEHADKSSYTPVGPQIAEFHPVWLYWPLECDEVTMQREGALEAEIRDEAEAQTALRLARVMAGSNGAEWLDDPDCGVSVNPTLSQPYPGVTFGEAVAEGSSENDIVGAAGNSPSAAFAILLGAYAASTFKGGATIHTEVDLLPSLIAHAGVRQVGDIYVGPENSVVIPHASLPGPASDDAGTPTANTAGNLWMYATGPVEFEMDEVRIMPETRSARVFGRQRTDIWSVLAERFAIYRFNPSVVKATQALIPTTGL